MPDIRHRVGINASRQSAYEALSTVDGLTRWWTRDVRGDAEKELDIRFDADRPGVIMRVVELVPAERIVWECTDGPAEWLGTTVTFDVSDGPGAGETVVVFTHAGWREADEFLHHCSTKWAQFLLGLKSGLEDGRWQPHPELPSISSWS